MPDLGQYHILGSRRIDTTYGVDPGYSNDWVAFMIGNFDRGVNLNKYYDGDWERVENEDWKRVEKDGEQYYTKTVKRILSNPRGRAIFRGISAWKP